MVDRSRITHVFVNTELAGIKTYFAHLTENIHALDISYTDEEMKAINRELDNIVIFGDRYNANSQANIGK